ncbi:hypothetical protein [Leptolyngbya subtilissima]|uniref:Ferritin-like domain-containing protein n=1 Tax=Leptolyngbya subtilissima DQ-A4 TaxID=2933933 RepID=A0ABV0JZJ2_9CYAN|nr:hypothetical protein [Nodosilinea sp. FACHB-141]
MILARKPKLGQNRWVLDQVLPLNSSIAEQYFTHAPNGVWQNFCSLLSRDVYSEGDSQSLYDYVMSRQAEMSADFLAMLGLWLADELKHYEALRRTYHCLSGVSFVDMDRCFSERVHDFDPLQITLQDEFTLLVTLMFDEIGSVYSYRRDLAEYYQHFGPNIQKIGHHLVKDEGMHFNNAAELLLAHHQHRLGDVRAFLEKISQLEGSLKTYYKTFFLDHAQEQYRFPKHFNQVIIRVILARLGLGQQPTSKELKELWQWIPEGYSLVPIFDAATRHHAAAVS